MVTPGWSTPSPPVPEPHPRLSADDLGTARWLQSLYPLWTASIDEEAEHLPLGSVELHCRCQPRRITIFHPVRAGDLLGAEIRAASELGMRFHPTYASMSLGASKGGLPPDEAVRDEDDILAESQRAVERHHDPRHGSMVQIALAPCSPFTVSTDLMMRSAELAERLDVRLHTHLAENAEDDEFALATSMRLVDYYEHRVGSDRVAHVVS